MNPLLSALTGGNGAMSIMMQAVGAAMRGERPEDFMKGLAKTNSQLRGLDLDNLEQTANDLAKQKGADMGQLTESVKKTIGGLL